MRKRKQPQSDLIDVNSIGLDLGRFIEQAIIEKRHPAITDIEKLKTYSPIDLCAVHSRLDGASKLIHNWQDCLCYVLLLLSVSEKAAEYNCPKSRWLTQIEVVS